jgi:hypothetical protein
MCGDRSTSSISRNALLVQAFKHFASRVVPRVQRLSVVEFEALSGCPPTRLPA